MYGLAKQARCLTLVSAFGLMLGGCAHLDRATLLEHTQRDLALSHPASLTDTSSDINPLLARPLDRAAAERLMLLHSPALRALIRQAEADIAQSAASGRPANPVLGFTRLTGPEVEIERALSIGLFDLLTWPQRQRVSTAAQQQQQLQLSMTLLSELRAVRLAWVDAVAAQQQLSYAEDVAESAAIAGDLADKMQKAGSISALDLARQRAFAAEAANRLTEARLHTQQQRERLIRQLGLNDEQAASLALPEQLPDLPATARSAEQINQRVKEQRLDVRLARAALATAAAEQSLSLPESYTRAELTLHAKRTGPERSQGWELGVALPVFDTGELTRQGMDARTQAAALQLDATLRRAGSSLRSQYGDYLTRFDIARRQRSTLLPLREQIAHENLLRYNGMLISVFELLDSAREQINTVIDTIEAERRFWQADAALESELLGAPTLSTGDQP
ncbi:transporter [Burkholderiaceae bacterium DAT-1]|nr:transporter [Burkholderiaceae bacterium DAT-1]